MYRYPTEQLMTVEEAERLSGLQAGRERRNGSPVSRASGCGSPSPAHWSRQ